VTNLIHGREVEPQMGQEREGELEAGVEKEVEEVGASDRLEPFHVVGAHIFQGGELSQLSLFVLISLKEYLLNWTARRCTKRCGN